jgi:hypothetical protein
MRNTHTAPAPAPVPRLVLDALDATIARTEGQLAGRRLGLALRAAVGLGTTRAEGLVRAAEHRLAWLQEQRRGLHPPAAVGDRARAADPGRGRFRRAA